MRSDLVKKGSTRAAHRSLFYALGFSDEDLKKPLIAVVNSQTDIIAGHAHLVARALSSSGSRPTSSGFRTSRNGRMKSLGARSASPVSGCPAGERLYQCYCV